MNIAQAKEYFIQCDGLHFHMSREDHEAWKGYLQLNISTATEALWLAELTALKLRLLKSPGNFMIVSFLLDHEDFRYLDEVAVVPPCGSFYEKCAYLEAMLEYVHGCRGIYHKSQLKAVVETIANHANLLRRRLRAKSSLMRVDAIAETVARLSKQLR